MRSKLFFLCFALFALRGLSGPVDSLRKIIASGANDSLKSVAYVNLTYSYGSEPGKILDLAAEMTAYASGITNKKMKALWLRKIGAIYHKRNLYDKALEFGLQSANLYEQLNDKAGLASCFNNIGNAYAGKGTLTSDRVLLERSIEYHLKCMKIRKEMGDTILLRNSYNNIAIGYMEKKDLGKALEYLEIAYKEYKKPPVDENGIEMVTLNMADAYLAMGTAQKNADYLTKSLGLYESQLAKYPGEDNLRSAGAMIRIGTIYLELNDKAKALDYLQKGMAIAGRLKDTEARLDASDPLAELYEKSGDYKKALEYLHLFVSLKDSMINERNSQNIEQMQALYQSSQKDREIQQLNADKEIQDEKLNRQRVAIFSTIGGLLLILILGFVLLSRYNLKKKANRQLSDAYGKIELKNRQITDSINYARRIQHSILPPDQELKRHLSSFFVFYAPKDIVSGDFYWFSRTDGYLFFVVADCTGHGVPGALMSMIGNTLLNEIINQKKILDPGEILFHLNKGVITALHQQEKDLLTQDDGMDISICCISESDHTHLKYAAANHSIFVKHNNTVKELTGDIFSIGGSIGANIRENHRQFETREIILEKGSFVIMSTDGYYDQFGGTHDSKFLVTAFEKLILDADLEKDAAAVFKTAFESWKGPQKQTDDILVAGFKV